MDNNKMTHPKQTSPDFKGWEKDDDKSPKKRNAEKLLTGGWRFTT